MTLNIDLGGTKRRNTVNGLWKVMDIKEPYDFYYDITSGKRINLEDETVDNYYTSYTLFFAKQSLTTFVLSEFYRTLKNEGKVRIVVPDIEESIRWYYENAELFKFKYAKPPQYPETRLGYLMALFHTEDTYVDGELKTVGVQQAFDFETLKYYLEQVKFTNVVKMSYNECSPVFNEKDYKRYDGRALFVEAQKVRNE